MKATKTPKALSRQVSLHHKVQQKAAALVKVAEAAHAEHRKAKELRLSPQIVTIK
jgi:hypothetical protein